MGQKAMRPRMDALAVGLAAPCDPPGVEERVKRFFTEKFDGAPSLPFIAWVTHDFQYVHGFTGGRTAAQFERDMQTVAASPLVPATREVEQQLAALAGQAAEAAEAGKWPAVLAAARAGAKLKGRCDPSGDPRARLATAVEEARDWAASRFDWVEDSVAGATDLAPLRAALQDVRKQFKGEPEADTAKRGLAAVAAAARNAKLAGEKAAAARAKAAHEFAGTRWASLFAD